ncbi:hypothetical protein NQ318_004961 [Aromia moschata]|uniref:Cytochrome P450 n=1 Tax=Aromia moschata TaxID=1265417 RepID=A0AAV8XDH6_9CUCU|nr:hypothetical protein NQ318_004961 [Aromia moschata]
MLQENIVTTHMNTPDSAGKKFNSQNMPSITAHYEVDENLVIEKGVVIFIPIRGIHYDEEYYENPDEFDPDRFSEANKKTRHPL